MLASSSPSLLATVREARGSHSTGMLTYLIGQGTNMTHALSHLQHELTTACNIKDRLNRKAVTDALGTAIVRLQMLKTVPVEGLAVYAGQLV